MVRVLVRDVSKAYDACVTMEQKGDPISVQKTRETHDKMIEAFQKYVPGIEIVNVEADDSCPDCMFIEDTCVASAGKAVINYMGHELRRAETKMVREKMVSLGIDVRDMPAPASCDGGDVMHTDKELFVGLSQRTNQAGADFLQSVHSHLKVVPVPVSAGLHLKSCMTWIGDDVGFIVGEADGRRIFEEHVRPHRPDCPVTYVPDDIAGNMLRIKDVVFYMNNFPSSQPAIDALAAKHPGLKWVGLDMTEVNKGDGAITCCSVVLW